MWREQKEPSISEIRESPSTRWLRPSLDSGKPIGSPHPFLPFSLDFFSFPYAVPIHFLLFHPSSSPLSRPISCRIRDLRLNLTWGCGTGVKKTLYDLSPQVLFPRREKGCCTASWLCVQITYSCTESSVLRSYLHTRDT